MARLWEMQWHCPGRPFFPIIPGQIQSFELEEVIILANRLLSVDTKAEVSKLRFVKLFASIRIDIFGKQKIKSLNSCHVVSVFRIISIKS